MKLRNCEHGNQFAYINETKHPDVQGMSWVKCRVCGQTEAVHIPILGESR